MNNLELVILDRTKAGKLLHSKTNGGLLTHVVSIHDYNAKPASGFLGHPAKKLRLCFDDISQELAGYVACEDVDIQKIIDFGEVLKQALEVKDCFLLTHCHAGISRSTAAAFILLCVAFGPHREGEALDKVLSVQPKAHPNQRMIGIADRLLNRKSALINALFQFTSTKMYGTF